MLKIISTIAKSAAFLFAQKEYVSLYERVILGFMGHSVEGKSSIAAPIVLICAMIYLYINVLV